MDNDILNATLKNLRVCTWKLAQLAPNRAEMFEDDDNVFAPRIWTPAHGCTPPEWTKLKQAYDESLMRPYPWTPRARSKAKEAKGPSPFWTEMERRKKQRAEQAARYVAIVAHLRAEFETRRLTRRP